jgi:hemolysin activation/secretion protein
VNFDTIWAHSASYLAPLPWRHNLAVFGAYTDSKSDVNGSVSTGSSFQASMRYSIPRRVSRNYIDEFSAGFDYKHTDNDLEFGGQTTLPTTKVEVYQFQLGYSGLLSDHWGQTSFGLEGYYSPGNLSDDNTDAHFNELRPASQADYYYGRLTLERITTLPYNFSWMTRFFGQAASTRLTPSEQMGIGGYGTVRGYGERFANGDQGFVLNNELRSPPFPLVSLINDWPLRDQFQILGFFDYGTVFITDFNAADAGSGLHEKTTLSSLGVGLRYSLARNLVIRFDYGFQMMMKESGQHSGAHVGVLVSY